MDSNNCHIRPTPLQAAIYRRIFRCLYDRFLDCPLSFARLLENPTYAAIADCKFLDSNGQIYALRPCTLVTENGAVHALTEGKRLPTDAQTICEPGIEQAELTWCILHQDGARQRVAYVLSDKLEGSLNFMSADAQANGLQALFENERKDNILRLLTDDVFLTDFTQTLGRYASTLFPQQESLLDFEAPVIDFFEYSDADAEHIVKAVLLAKSLGILTVGKAELGDDPVRFRIPAVAAILAVPFLLNGTSRLLEREKSAEAIIGQNGIDRLAQSGKTGADVQPHAAVGILRKAAAKDRRRFAALRHLVYVQDADRCGRANDRKIIALHQNTPFFSRSQTSSELMAFAKYLVISARWKSLISLVFVPSMSLII